MLVSIIALGRQASVAGCISKDMPADGPKIGSVAWSHCESVAGGKVLEQLAKSLCSHKRRQLHARVLQHFGYSRGDHDDGGDASSLGSQASRCCVARPS